jgi:hypothetical protein
MVVDGYRRSFAYLTRTELPRLLRKLKAASRKPVRGQLLVGQGNGVSAILRAMGRKEVFSGAYLFLRNGKPIYVGISRNVAARLRSHLRGRSHFDASLAFMMAKGKTGMKGKRADLMKKSIFIRAFRDAQWTLVGCRVAVIEIPNPLVLYAFEVYAAMQLDTGEWNTFRTH